MTEKKCWVCKKVLPEDDVLTKKFAICESCAKERMAEGEGEDLFEEEDNA